MEMHMRSSPSNTYKTTNSKPNPTITTHTTSELKDDSSSTLGSVTFVTIPHDDPEAQMAGGHHSMPGCPDGGSAAWMVVVGGFLTYFATFGMYRNRRIRCDVWTG